MLKALVWKEWRAQRPVMLAGLAAALTMPCFLAIGAFTASTRLGAAEAVEMAIPVLAMGIWPLFGAAATATAGEVGQGTMPFLLSRPVSRFGLWVIKSLGALVATLVLVVVSALALELLRGSLESGDGTAHGVLYGLRDVSGAGLTFVLLVVACTLFTSNFFERPLVAGLTGLLMAAATAYVTSLSASMGLLGGRLAVAQLLLLPVAIVVGAAFGFLRAGVFQASDRWRRAGRALGLMLLLWVGPSVPLLWAGIRIPVDEGAFSDLAVHPDGDRFAVTVRKAGDGGIPLVWLLHRDGRVERLGPRRSAVVGFTGDGEWLVYESHGLLPGIFSEYVPELRAVRLDGTDDHELVRGRRYGRVHFAPRGDRMAVAVRRDGRRVDLVLLRASTGVEHRIDPEDLGLSWPGLPRTPRLRVSAWLDDGTGLLLQGSDLRRGPDEVLGLLDPDTGEARTLPLSFQGATRPGDIDLVDVEDGRLVLEVRQRVGDRRSPTFRYHLDIYDIASGESRRLLTRPTRCWRARLRPIDDDLRRVLFVDCDTDEAGLRGYRFLVADMSSSPAPGSAGDRTVARLRSDFLLLLGVRDDRVAVTSRGNGQLEPVVLDLGGGGVRRLPGGWRAMQWISDDEVLLARSGSFGHSSDVPSEVAVADLETGVLHSVYPPGRPDGSFR